LKDFIVQSVPKGKSNAIGSGMKLIACSIELPLLERIDALAKRDGIKRASWIREAIISAADGSRKFQRTPVQRTNAIKETIIPLTPGGSAGITPKQKAQA
jgi:hypothetical protein